MPGMLLGDNGRYRVERLLHKGVDSQLYVGYDTFRDHNLIIKCLVRFPSESPWQRHRAYDRFQKSVHVQMLASAICPTNIPAVYSFMETYQCAIMQFVEGNTLLSLLNRQVAPLDEHIALTYIRDVSAVIAALHDRPQPLVHLDLKPNNLLLDRNERVWLIDFGLAQVIFSDQKSLPFTDGGSVGFAPPEQWEGVVELRSDVYALAATLYTLVTNYVPSSSTTGDHAKVLRPSAREFNPHLSIAVEELILNGLADSVTERPSAREWLQAVQALL